MTNELTGTVTNGQAKITVDTSEMDIGEYYVQTSYAQNDKYDSATKNSTLTLISTTTVDHVTYTREYKESGNVHYYNYSLTYYDANNNIILTDYIGWINADFQGDQQKQYKNTPGIAPFKVWINTVQDTVRIEQM